MIPGVYYGVLCLGGWTSVDTDSVQLDTCGAEIALPHWGWTGLCKRCHDYARCAYNIGTLSFTSNLYSINGIVYSVRLAFYLDSCSSNTLYIYCRRRWLMVPS
jgi:hypothetical protein